MSAMSSSMRNDLVALLIRDVLELAQEDHEPLGIQSRGYRRLLDIDAQLTQRVIGPELDRRDDLFALLVKALQDFEEQVFLGADARIEAAFGIADVLHRDAAEAFAAKQVGWNGGFVASDPASPRAGRSGAVRPEVGTDGCRPAPEPLLAASRLEHPSWRFASNHKVR
jgi:hypothetical protein